MNSRLEGIPTMNTPRILMIYTGGTIGMIESRETGSLVPFDFRHLIDNVPKLRKLHYHIHNIQFDPIDSSDMNAPYWQRIAGAIADNYEAFDGFVVLHGTDTMAYTASALSFMLEGLAKPVIITGSQLPIGEVRTDGEENLLTAVQIAAERRPDGSAMVQEVAILFENYLWRGNRSTKASADDFNAFKSNNFPPLARIGLTITYNEPALHRADPAVPFRLVAEMDPSVIELTLTPSLNEQTLEHVLATPGARALVLRTYGGGNGPTASWFCRALKKAVERGLIIVNVTQCASGGVMPMRYEAGRGMAAAGVISGGDMTFEAALTKLMHLLAMYPAAGEEPDWRALITESICGELTREK